jgi:hypothetical protein
MGNAHIGVRSQKKKKKSVSTNLDLRGLYLSDYFPISRDLSSFTFGRTHALLSGLCKFYTSKTEWPMFGRMRRVTRLVVHSLGG